MTDDQSAESGTQWRYLSLVRWLGELARQRCHPDCSESIHRQEAALYLNILIDHPELIDALAGIAGRINDQRAIRGTAARNAQIVRDVLNSGISRRYK